MHQLFEDFVRELNPSNVVNSRVVNHLDPYSYSDGQFADSELNLTVVCRGVSIHAIEQMVHLISVIVGILQTRQN